MNQSVVVDQVQEETCQEKDPAPCFCQMTLDMIILDICLSLLTKETDVKMACVPVKLISIAKNAMLIYAWINRKTALPNSMASEILLCS